VPTIVANGLEIGYETIGAGPPLVMLHGATTTGRAAFAAQIEPLATAFLVVLPDARGHGWTRWDADDGFRAEWLIDDLVGFVDAFGLATFHLCGYSMGAMTALGFAARAPDRVRTLVVAGIAPDREPRASVTRRLMDPARILRDEPSWAADLAGTLDPTQGPDAWQRLLPAIAQDVAVQPLLTAAELRSISAPTLVICGDRDPLVPVGQAWQLARQVRDGRLLVVPDSGHDVLVRRPGLVNDALLEFYRSTEPVARRRADARSEMPP
jgi:pimeloyl-ACP methyl ester carboxylesterase